MSVTQALTAGWLKLKYPPDKMQFLDNRVRFLYPNFLVYPATVLKFLKSYFSFLESYGCINILCHIFNSERSNQQQLVIFIVKKH